MVPCEQQLDMGESILRDREIPYESNAIISVASPYRKGSRLRFRHEDVDIVRQRKGRRRRQREPWEELSFLFNSLFPLESVYPEIGIHWLGKHLTSRGVRCALVDP